MNKDGYTDRTADKAIYNVQKEQKVINSVKSFCERKGYIVDIIKLKRVDD